MTTPGAVTGLPWLVAVPGFAVDRYFERPGRAVAERGVNVSLVPAPGSRRHGGHPDVAECGAAVAAFVRRTAGGRRPVIAGHSAGAQAALHAAVELGDEALALLLVGPTPAPAQRTGGLLACWASDMFLERPSLLASQTPDWLRAGPRRLTATLRSTLADAPETVAPRLRVPMVVARGSRDPLCPSSWADQLAAAAPDGRVLTIPDAPHSWPYSEPDAFADVVDQMLARFPVGRPG